MICNFKTQIKGNPTLFPEKIVAGAIKYNLVGKKNTVLICSEYITNIIFKKYNFDCSVFSTNVIKPKLHTLRIDKNKRYQVGKKLHLSINARQKNYCQILPQLVIQAIQKVEIKVTSNNIYVIVDERELTKKETIQFAINDGFDDVFQFFYWFNKNQILKLIHWVPGFKY